MLTLEEVKNFLEADQKQIEDYIKAQKLHAYKIGGTYLRFRKEEVMALHTGTPSDTKKGRKTGSTFFSKIYDFWRFNNFYIIASIIIAGLVVYVVKT